MQAHVVWILKKILAYAHCHEMAAGRTSTEIFGQQRHEINIAKETAHVQVAASVSLFAHICTFSVERCAKHVPIMHRQKAANVLTRGASFLCILAQVLLGTNF